MIHSIKHSKTFSLVFSFLAVLAITTHFSAEDTFAATKIARTSASLVTVENTVEDNRAQILRAYLVQYDSPLVPYAQVFVDEADKNNLDWRLVASIAGVESTFGKRVPYNSYNGWGWGVYGNQVLRFASWDEAITTISRDLRVKYMDKRGAENVVEIGRIYASDPKWAGKVMFFMNQIEAFEKGYKSSALPISI